VPRLARLRRIAAQRLPIATKDQLRAVEAQTTAWRQAYERLLAAAENRPVRKAPRNLPATDPADKVRATAAQATDAVLLREVQNGKPLDDVLARAVRQALSKKRHAEARAIAAGVASHQASSELGALLTAIVASAEGHHRLALHHFDRTSSSLRLRRAPVEYFASLFAADRERGLAEVRELVASPKRFGAKTWFEILRQVFVTSDVELTQAVHANVVERHRANPAGWPMGDTELAWIDRWIGVQRNRTAQQPPAGRVSFGLIDYLQPGRARASQNIGDQIQTLASMGHLVRHQNLRFHGDADVVDFTTRMQERVRPELKVDSPAADVQLFTVDRDSTTYQAFPEDTWLLEFGWHMHALMGLDVYDFPLHPNLRPIFVSFHCSKRELLSDEAVEYLKAHGPIGCRDWTTVDLLLSLDVEAFFSGCLTTTVNTVFPELERKPDPATLYVDVVRSTVPAGHENVKQSYGAIKKRTFSENMQDAVDLLERYRRNYTDVVTMRLHCYLPTTSLGLKVQFEPKNNADVRFNGLFRLNDQEFEAIRTSMRDRLQPVVEAIVAGKPAPDVYALWREVNAADVAIAKERHARPAVIEPTGEAAVAAARALTPSAPTEDAVDVVLTPAPGQVKHVATVLASAAAHASRPLRAWVVGRFEGDAPGIHVDGVEVRVVDTSGIADDRVADLRELDRTLLPELLPVDRAVLLPVDAVVARDVVELATTDLGESLVAGRDTSRASDSGFGVVYTATRHLDDAWDTAYEFYRQIHQRHVFDFDAFDTDVMVLDLAGLRERGFATQAISAMHTFRLDDRAAFHWFVGADRAVLDATWAYVPTREWIDEPALWHWADATKPWSEAATPGKDLWLAASRTV
jgi:hypothetical protein